MSKKQTKKTQIFIVDDHAMFRDGLRQLIDREADLVVCGDAAEATSALEEITRLKPDLVIVDISLSGESGIDLIRTIKDQHEELPVLVVSMHEESLYAERALHAGALGYVMKQEPAKVLKAAIRKVLNGDMHLSERMAGSVFAKSIRNSDSLPPSPIEKLSDREFEVFQLIGQGKSTRDIATQLHLSPKTVDVHRGHVKEKLELKDATSLVRHAVRWVETQGQGQ